MFRLQTVQRILPGLVTAVILLTAITATSVYATGGGYGHPSPQPTPAGCPNPTVKPTDTPHPTQTPGAVTPTPVTETPTPGPTITPTGQPNPTPAPTGQPNPTSTPVPTSPPGGGGGDSSSGGGGSSGGGTSVGSGSPSVCTDSKPIVPGSISATRISPTSALVIWGAVPDATTYSILYGTAPGSRQFGVADTGNVTAYTIGSLNPGTGYYFAVRAVHGCMPGDTTADSVAGPPARTSVGESLFGGQVLGVSTDALPATGNAALSVYTVTLAAGIVLMLLGVKTTLPKP
jgi:hypothetical protein